MLILLGPEFTATEMQLAKLARATGLVAYDLRTRLRPGSWGVLKAVGDHRQAQALVTHLNATGVPAVAVDSTVGGDPARKIVYLRGLELQHNGMLLKLNERQMTVPYQALVVVVRGEVRVGRSLRSAQWATSAVAGRAVAWAGRAEPTPMGDGRDPAVTDVFAAADLHFATVSWVARIDARDLEFPAEFAAEANTAEKLDSLVDWLAAKANIRVDRQSRVSSVVSHASSSQWAIPGTSDARALSLSSDEHFDAYSRIIAEAERKLLAMGG